MVLKASRNGCFYALKTYPGVDDEYHRRFLQEAEILRQLNHPRIPRFIETFTQDDNRFLVQEFIQGYPLSYYLTAGHIFTESCVQEIIRQLLLIIDYLHRPTADKDMIFHRDLRLSNVIIDGGQIFLIDFGLARPAEENGLIPALPGVIKRQQLKSSTYRLWRRQASPQSDLFGAAIVAIDLLSSQIVDEHLFNEPWQSALPVSVGFRNYLESLLNQEFISAADALSALPTCHTSCQPILP